MTDALKNCPFCGMKPPADLSDTLYPTGLGWRDDDGIRHCLPHSERATFQGQYWGMNCTQNMGGCGAEVTGESREDAIAAWNRRAPPPPDEGGK